MNNRKTLLSIVIANALAAPLAAQENEFIFCPDPQQNQCAAIRGNMKVLNREVNGKPVLEATDWHPTQGSNAMQTISRRAQPTTP